MSVGNSPFGTLFEQVNAAAYTAHPYGWPGLSRAGPGRFAPGREEPLRQVLGRPAPL